MLKIENNLEQYIAALNSPNEAAGKEIGKAEKRAWLCLFVEALMERVKMASTINRHE